MSIEHPGLKTVRGLLEDSSSLIIPDYQREYTWKNEDLLRLIETIVSDINSKKEVTFLGSIILSNKGKTIHTTKYDIVDGQQRTISMLLILLSLHSIISKLLAQSSYKSNSDLIAKQNDILEQLKNRCSLLRREDGKDKNVEYILQKLKIAKHENHLSKDEIKKKEETEQFLTEVLQYALSIGSPVLENSTKFNGIFEEEDKESFRVSRYNDDLIEKIKLLYKHCIDRVTFIEIVVSEDYAYDVFERFNTAGDPLTAFETFKPLVIADLRNKKIDEKAREHIKAIGEFLIKWSKDSDRDRERNKITKNTQNFIIWFGYLFSGGIKKGDTRRAIAKDLSAQRKYLRDTYNQSKEQKKDMVDSMYLLHKFIRDCWAAEKNNLHINNFIPDDCKQEDVKTEIDECAFCLDFLRDVKHTISVPLLSYFFQQFVENKTKEKLDDFINIVKICSAFFCLWRSSRHSTGAIDEKYRRIYFRDSKGNKGLFEKNNGWSVKKVREYFKKQLRENKEYPIKSYQDWIKKTTETKLGDKLTRVAKFILLTASHDTRIKNNKLERKSGILPIINDDSWGDTKYKTLEHIVPLNRKLKKIPKESILKLQAKNEEDYYKIINTLGNLTLIPRKLNSGLNNQPIEDKIKYLKKKKKDQYFPLLEFLKHLNPDKFNKNYIEERTENISSLSWEILAEDWLEWNK